MLDDETSRSLASFAVFVSVQIYNTYAHNQTKAKLTATEARLTVTDADLRADIDSARMALERLTVKVQGGDRRGTGKPLMSKTDADAAGRRFTDRAGGTWPIK